MFWSKDQAPLTYQSGAGKWSEFLGRWYQVRFEKQAVSMLHEAADIREDFSPTVNVDQQRIDFFLHYSQCRIESLEWTARQLLVGRLLRFQVKTENLDLVDSHRQVIMFLGKRRDGLLKPPFPGHILEYLLNFEGVWLPPKWSKPQGKCPHEHHHEEEKPNDCMAVHEAFQAMTKDFVYAMLEWGWASYLSIEWQTDEVKRLIESYLVEHDWNEGKALHRISIEMTGGEKARLDYGDTTQQIVNGAALGRLLSIRFLSDPGSIFQTVSPMPALDSAAVA